MKILYMAKTALAGVCEKMTRIVNSYCKPAHEARVCNAGAGKHSWYQRPPEDLIPQYSIKDEDHVSECIEWADVIHCMANVGIRSALLSHIDKERLLKSKRWVFQWHGAQVWDFADVWHPDDYKHVRFLHIGQGWIQTQRDFFDPFIEKWGLKVVPNLITGDDPLHTPRPWSERKNKTGFSPSQNREQAVNRKGIKATLGVLHATRYKATHPSLDLIHGMPFERCLSRKAKCRLGIDEVVTPMYHLSGLEFLAQGTPCICSTTPHTDDVLRRVTGCDRIPFINADIDSLSVALQRYWARSDDDRQEMGREARSWFDQFYHPRQLVEKYIDVYEESDA